MQQLPFPLLNENFFTQYSNDSNLIGQLNQEMLHLNHKCQFKWMDQSFNEWEKDQVLKVFVISWNMHGMIPNHSLKRLFNIDRIHHDIIVIGTQECSRSIGVSLICANKQSWEDKLQHELGIEYVRVKSTSLNAMHLIVFIHKSIVPKLKNPKSYSFAQGFMNLVGNKGGIAISINLDDKIFLFVNSHLESGQNSESKRMEQFFKQESQFELEALNHHNKIPYDYVIWTGDFNSRVNDSILTSTIKTHSDFFGWLEKDQMYQSRRASEAYQSQFKEGMIFFPPTYKLLETFNQWCVGKDFRIPGWCDRILFKENTNKTNNEIWSLRLENYDANFDILGSDHRPVFAQFSILLNQ